MNLQPVNFKAIAAKGAYVYCYLREDGTPYYVGISEDGTGKRPFGHHAVAVPKKHVERVRVMRSGLSYEEAQQLEIRYIKHYGRKDLGTGILRNQTDGGDGAKGAIRSDSTKSKQSAASTRYQNPAEREKTALSQKGKHSYRQTPEFRAKLSLAMRGRVPYNKGISMSEAQKQRVSQSKKGISRSCEHVSASAKGLIAKKAQEYGWDIEAYAALTNSQRANLNRQYRRNAAKASACGMTAKAYAELSHSQKIALGRAA